MPLLKARITDMTTPDAERERMVLGAMVGYFNTLARRICFSVGRADLYEDARQVAWMELWKLSESYDPARNDNFSKSAYLRTKGAIRDFVCPKKLRDRRGGELFYRHIDLLPDTGTESTFTPLLSDWRSGLTDKERIVVDLSFWEDLTAAEIGRRLGMTTRGVTARKWTAIAKLRKRFNAPVVKTMAAHA